MKITIIAKHSDFNTSDLTLIKAGSATASVLKTKGRYYATCTGDDRSDLYMLLVQLKERYPNVILRSNYQLLHTVAKSLNWTSRSTKPWPKVVDLYTTEGTPQETGYAKFRQELAQFNQQARALLSTRGLNIYITEAELAATCSTPVSAKSYWKDMVDSIGSTLVSRYNMESS